MVVSEIKMFLPSAMDSVIQFVRFSSKQINLSDSIGDETSEHRRTIGKKSQN